MGTNYLRKKLIHQLIVISYRDRKTEIRFVPRGEARGTKRIEVLCGRAYERYFTHRGRGTKKVFFIPRYEKESFFVPRHLFRTGYEKTEIVTGSTYRVNLFIVPEVG
jgi:hypothetical protein